MDLFTYAILKRTVGASAYEIAVLEGFTGTESEWIASLVGPMGPQGPQGPQGEPGGSSTPQVQADWNQNDETAVDYVKNRICYTADVEVLDLQNAEFSVTDSGAALILSETEIVPLLVLTPQHSVTVTIDGTVYSNATVVDDVNMSLKISDADGNTIFESVWGKNGGYVYLSQATDSLHSVTISAKVASLIDKKFLPESAKIWEIGTGSKAVKSLSATEASGDYSHAEGWGTTASGDYSHAECSSTTASGGASHAEGWGATASGSCSHAEGWGTTASGEYSHAEGWGATASGGYSHAEGYYTTASGGASHAEGKYNVIDAENKYVHIVGNGTSTSNRSNAHTLDWDGNAWYSGTVSVGTETAPPEVVKNNDLTTKKYVDEVLSGAGGSTWRKITSITLTEPATRIIVTTDDDGNAFSLKKMYVRVFAKSADEATSRNLIVRIDNAYIQDGNIQVSNGVKNDGMYSVLSFECIGNLVRAVAGGTVTGGQINLTTTTANQSGIDRSEINIVHFAAAGLIEIGIGSRFEIWGVDA